MTKPNTFSENSYIYNGHYPQNNFLLSNVNPTENIHYTKYVQNSNNSHYSPKQHDLEKLFNHATEVKGDLESVIHALVGIIGTGSKENGLCNDTLNIADSHHLANNVFKNNLSQTVSCSDYGNKWSNDNVPSVNVENVLKIVRANKNKYKRPQFFNDSSQSSGSSKERFMDKRALKTHFQSRNIYQDNMRPMVNDHANVVNSKMITNELETNRKHKSEYEIYKDYENWYSTDNLIKKIKSIKAVKPTNNEVVEIETQNKNLITEHMVTDNISMWKNAADPVGNNGNQFTDNLGKYNWNVSDLTNCCNNRNFPNFNLTAITEPINDFSANVYIDESSCSSWSKMSNTTSHTQNSKPKTISSLEKRTDKQTPSVSPCDSEGSIEPIRDPPVKRIPRLPSLCTQLKSKQGRYELILLNQPEQQHRARYMTEGSRGAVKDRSGNGYPTLELFGWNQPATLQIFVASENGRVKPHNFYQTCKVSGKQILSCKERVFDNTGLIEVQLEPKESQIVILDCIGILKLRNVDVERRAGNQRIKQKSTMARLVFRINLPHGNGHFTCLQVISDPILCTQPIGSPEISKMSIHEGSCKGNMELFIIGKNILKSSRVIFQHCYDHREIIWQAEAKIDLEYLQQTHLICTIPPFCDENIKTLVTVQVVLNCDGRVSEPRNFTYLPEVIDIPKTVNKSFTFSDWKMENTNFSDVPSFSTEKCQSNLEFSDHMKMDTIKNLPNENLCGMNYLQPTEKPFNSHGFASLNTEENFSLFSLNNVQQDIPNISQLDWRSSIGTNGIPIPLNMTASSERFPNSLDSNIDHDCMLQEGDIIQTPEPESIINLNEPSDILKNL